MKEYEYIVEAIDEYLTDELVGVICTENYTNKSYVHGHRRIFDLYRTIHKEYEKYELESENPQMQKIAREEFNRQCREKRLKMQNAFLIDIQKFCGNVSIKDYQNEYLQKLQKEDVQTVSKRTYLYPYLVTVSRKIMKEASQSNGKKI